MKIIAKTGEYTFLLEASADEIDRLAGKQIGKAGAYSWQRDIPFGTEFNIIKAFDQIYRNGQRKREIETVRKTLEGVINSLDIIDPFIEEPQDKEPEAEVSV